MLYATGRIFSHPMCRLLFMMTGWKWHRQECSPERWRLKRWKKDAGRECPIWFERTWAHRCGGWFPNQSVPKRCDSNNGNAGEKQLLASLPEQEAQIYKYIVSKGQITSAQTAEILGVKERRARTILGHMIKANIIKKVEAAKNTKYMLI